MGAKNKKIRNYQVLRILDSKTKNKEIIRFCAIWTQNQKKLRNYKVLRISDSKPQQKLRNYKVLRILEPKNKKLRKIYVLVHFGAV